MNSTFTQGVRPPLPLTPRGNPAVSRPSSSFATKMNRRGDILKNKDLKDETGEGEGDRDSANTLPGQLALFEKQHFTGRLDIDIQGQKWCLYLSLGRLAWASGGGHPQRRWRRQLLPMGVTEKIQVRESDRFECWDYQILALLAGRKRIDKEQQVAIVRGIVTEVLFDLIQGLKLAALSQGEEKAKGWHEMQEGEEEALFDLVPRLGMRPSHSDTGILPRDWTLEIESAWAIAEKGWEQWSKSGLALCSPNLAPVLKRTEKLQEMVSPKIYQYLHEYINGKRTLRDLSVLMKKDLLGLTRSLLPYIRHHAIGLVEIEDLSPPQTTRQESKPKQSQGKEQRTKCNKGLVVCVDDSPQIRGLMEELLGEAGYRVITVGEAANALPTLLQYKPDMIFLDLMMPIANGYEICTQIRRVEKFKNTPVVILTGNNGFVDRLRAKMVGATDFLSKPIQSEKILATVGNFLK